LITAVRVFLAILCLAPLAGAQVTPEDLLRTGRAADARHMLDQQVQQDPNNAQAYHLLCRLDYQLELWDASLKMAEKSVALSPQNSAYHEWLGRAAGRKAENSNPFTAFNLARRVHAEFERAVALDGNNFSARADLAEYYLEAPGFLGGDKSKARQQADAVAAKSSGLAEYIRARVDEKQGNSQAEQEYKKAITSSGNDSRYWTELAYFYRRAGRMQDMETAISQSLRASHQSNVPDYDGAYLLLRTGRNLPGAIQMLRSYLSGAHLAEEGPAFHAHLMLGTLLEKQGNKNAAAAEYRAALALAPEYRPARDALARISR
jgi:tetratricopeptide (TPR) repeat protein